MKLIYPILFAALLVFGASCGDKLTETDIRPLIDARIDAIDRTCETADECTMGRIGCQSYFYNIGAQSAFEEVQLFYSNNVSALASCPSICEIGVLVCRENLCSGESTTHEDPLAICI